MISWTIHKLYKAILIDGYHVINQWPEDENVFDNGCIGIQLAVNGNHLCSVITWIGGNIDESRSL